MLQPKLNQLKELVAGKRIIDLINPDAWIKSIETSLAKEEKKKEFSSNELFKTLIEWLKLQVESNQLSLGTDKTLSTEERALMFARMEWCNDLLNLLAPNEKKFEGIEKTVDEYISKLSNLTSLNH